MKELKWTNLNLPTYPDLDEMMRLSFDIINLEMKQKGDLSEDTIKTLAPVFAYLDLVKHKMKLELDLVKY